jgi:hypothetical protein
MAPFWIFVVFIGGIVIGSVIANITGALPTAEELAEQDQARFTKIEESQ